MMNKILPYSTLKHFSTQNNKKNHTCEEGGANPRISAWHLLMNLKNNYLSKKTVEVG